MFKTRMITLLTDFGLSDVYVGVMKGTIARVNPDLKIIDLTHEIPPQNIVAGRFCLMNSVAYFPTGTVHIAVVDPGVGSRRRGIAIQCGNCFLVGPDNGLFSGVLSRESAIAAVELTNSKYWRSAQPSTTFHGRDIFAAAGAHLANGVALTDLGESIDPNSLVQLQIPNCTVTPTGIAGYIQYIDRFGNLITNIPKELLAGKHWSVAIGRISDLPNIPSGQTYSNTKPGDLIAIVGSDGWLEIAVNGGSARSILQLEIGDLVQLNYIMSYQLRVDS
ncbi:MAG: SAM hydrolase/SAM-dependent halogenase family protein [Microcoleus sp.]